MNILTAGELTVGMLIMGYEELEDTPQMMTSIATLEESEFDLFEVPKQPKRINYKPWYKGYPWQVVEIAGPIVMVNSLGAQIGKTKLAPIIIFDTRYQHFIEVDDSYYLTFWQHYGITVELPAKVQKVEVEVTEPEAESVLIEKLQANEKYKARFPQTERPE